MTKKHKYKLYFTFLPILLVILDQLTKYWARERLADGPSIIVIKKLLSFTYVENRGAVWGLFQGKYNILAIVSVFIIIGVIYLLIRIPDTKRFLPLYITFLFVLSGAIGNLIDRVVLDFVTDFIRFDFIDFPVFNVADIFVTVPAFVLVILLCFVYKEEELSFLPFFSEKESANPKKKNH